MNEIKSLIDKINSGQFPSNFPHFGGANLIITNDTQRNFHEGDIVVCSEHASALSWLVTELKKIYNDEIDFMNKHDFYPYIGKLINKTLKRQELLFETMLHVVEEIESDWGVK
jgi:uncharacterized protein YsxB (DUF464 family)